MPWLPYDAAKVFQFGSGTGIDFDSDAELSIALVTASYTPNRATHDFWDDANANEVAGTNYTAGGILLTTKALAVVANQMSFTADSITWLQNAGGFTNARHAILFKNTGTPSTSRLIQYNDLGSDRGNVGGDLVLQFPAGLLIV